MLVFEYMSVCSPLGELLSARGLNSADSTSATHAEVEWNLPGVWMNNCHRPFISLL